MLEEPPQRALLAAGLPFGVAGAADIALALSPHGDAALVAGRSGGRAGGRDRPPATDPDVKAAAAAADGSVSRALAFLDEDALALRQRALDELDRLPALNANALHAMGDALAGTDLQPLAAFIDTVNVWLSRRLDARAGESGRGRNWSGWPTRGSASIGPPATSKPTIWSENPWSSACSACLPRPRAVDTYAPSMAGPVPALIVQRRPPD